MNPWLRLLAVLVAAIAVALLLKVLPPVVVLAAFIGGVAWVNHVLKTRARAEARGDEAAILGLKREGQDPFGLLGYPLALFARGNGPAIEDLCWGTWRGLEVKRFDVSFEPVVAATGAERSRFTCALAPLAGRVPHLVVEPWTFVTRLASEAPMPQVVTGPERFDAILHVRCEDEAFARALIDDAMARWLVDLGEQWGFEVTDSLAMVYGPGRRTGEVVPTLEVLQGFVDRVPEDARASGAVGTEGQVGSGSSEHGAGVG